MMKNCKDYSKNFMISCDWLQIHVKENEKLIEKELPYYQIKRTGQSKVWKNIYTIYDTVTNQEIATYTTNPNKCIMPDGHGVLQFNNQVLYINEDLKGYVETFLQRCNLQFVGVTRFDVAYDFNRFRNNLDPQLFIEQYAGKEIVRVGKKTNFAVYGKELSAGLNFETLKIGAKKSVVKMKLYNKTNELKVNLKPWIESAHAVNFPAPEDPEEIPLPIWRLEFSIDSTRSLLSALNENMDEEILKQFKKLENIAACEKGENDEKIGKPDFFKFHDLRILEIQNLYAIFQGLFKKKFRFKQNYTASRKTRMKDIELLVFDFPACQLHFIKQNPMVKESFRAEKILLRKLVKFKDEVQNLDEEITNEVDEMIDGVLNATIKKDLKLSIKRLIVDMKLDRDAITRFENVIGKISSLHGLKIWAKNNGINFKGCENYANDLYEMAQIKFEGKRAIQREKQLNKMCLVSNYNARKFDAAALDQYKVYLDAHTL